MGFGFKIIVEGDYACFTRPELKVERVSYDVPTPGACLRVPRFKEMPVGNYNGRMKIFDKL